jgi:hypothetical protein
VPGRYTPSKTQDPKTAVVTPPPHRGGRTRLGKHAPGETVGVRHPQLFGCSRQHFRGAPACMLSTPTGDGETAVTPCGMTHPRPSTRGGCAQPICPAWFAGSEVCSCRRRAFSMSSCSHCTPCPSPRLPKGGAGQSRACTRALVLGQGDQVRILPPPPNLVDSTGEGGGVRRTAKSDCAHQWVQKGARHVEGAR